MNKEIKRRTDVVGTCPNPAALLRLAGHVLLEQHDEWDGADRRYFSEQSMALLHSDTEEVSIPGTDRGIVRTADPHGVEKLHQPARRDGHRCFVQVSTNG